MKNITNFGIGFVLFGSFGGFKILKDIGVVQSLLVDKDLLFVAVGAVLFFIGHEYEKEHNGDK